MSSFAFTSVDSVYLDGVKSISFGENVFRRSNSIPVTFYINDSITINNNEFTVGRSVSFFGQYNISFLKFTLTPVSLLTQINNVEYDIVGELTNNSLPQGVNIEGNITIGKDITSIDEGLFSNMTNIDFIDFSNAIQLRRIGFNAFLYTSITYIDFSSCINLDFIGNYAFSNSSLEELYLTSNSSLIIEENAFKKWTLFAF